MFFVGAIVLSFMGGCIFMCIMFTSTLKKKEKQLESNRKNLDLVNQWLILKHSGIKLSDEIKKYQIKKIAVYGMGICGRHLVRELINSDISIAYALDRKSMKPYQKVEIRKLNGEMPKVDAVINTVLYDKELINDTLKKYFRCHIINLEDIVFESYVMDIGSK